MSTTQKNFKHKIVVQGQLPRLEAFRDHLLKLDYSPCKYINTLRDNYTIVLSRFNSGEFEVYSDDLTYWKNETNDNIEFFFNINDFDAFNCAKYIAAITNSEYVCSSGELWRFGNDNSPKYYEIRINSSGNVDLIYLNRFGQEEKYIFGYSLGSTLFKQSSNWYRLTAQEIIDFYSWTTQKVNSSPKINTTNTMETATKQQDNKAENRKLLGYKSPMDLFDGKVKAGSIFTCCGECYYANQVQYTIYALPQEIVTKWEPVFDEQKHTISNFGTHNAEVEVYSNGKIKYTSKKRYVAFTIDDIDTMIKSLKEPIQNKVYSLGYSLSVDLSITSAKNDRVLRFGCIDEDHRFSYSELLNIQDQYKKLQIK